MSFFLNSIYAITNLKGKFQAKGVDPELIENLFIKAKQMNDSFIVLGVKKSLAIIIDFLETGKGKPQHIKNHVDEQFQTQIYQMKAPEVYEQLMQVKHDLNVLADMAATKRDPKTNEDTIFGMNK